MSSCVKTKLANNAEQLDISLESAAYPLFWGSEAPSYFVSYIKEHFPQSKIVLIADENTAELFGLIYEAMFISADFEVIALTVTAGERVKSWNTAGQLLEAFAQNHVERGDLVISLGGGVVSDLAGFVAAIYQRGVAFAQISTSLLSMVDASVGSKTGVDLEAGKNLAGAFKQPVAILMDTDVLRSLPDDQYRCGLAEVCKTALLSGQEFVDFLLENSDAIKQKESSVVGEMVTRCVEFKASVVAQDEQDLGTRECLNYGHTLGHALETIEGYGTLSHGDGVAEGMRFAARVSAQVVHASLDFVRAQDALLDTFDLPKLVAPDHASAILQAMRSDKKVRSGAVRMVLLTAPGAWECVTVDEDVLYSHLDAWYKQTH